MYGIVAVRKTHPRDPKSGQESYLKPGRLTDPRFTLVQSGLEKAAAALQRVQVWENTEPAKAALEIVRAAVERREKLPYELKIVAMPQ